MSVPERIERASRFVEGIPPLPAEADAPPVPTASPGRVLVISADLHHCDLLLACLTRAGCRAERADPASVTSAVLAEARFDAVLLDGALAAADEIIARTAAAAPDIPILALASTPADARLALWLGAADFAPRDGRLDDLPAVIERNVIREGANGAGPRSSATAESGEAVLDAMLSALDTRDTEPEGHSERVTAWTMALAEALELGAEARYDIERGALLHDIGKIGVPDRILLKAGPLTPEEWAEVRRHPVIGFQMCHRIPFLRGAAQVILHHHERWDGTGYPDGLRGEMIPIGARIFAVADAYDAMTTDRPHRRATQHDIVVQELMRCRGTQFDPTVVEAFLRTQRGE